ncbi:unnamed protein product [Kuraishia capsulata CBS 1993]|uniref:Uracil-DNA glycosylase n=1 Tax=Kuraishia capsulata CBS 1993 TaxID=1382522 RepID=W6MQK4_9ASCO|nr:uncharacterized protein KUCA_T00005000001 [Kuraishia capsulata CBS 1993]CDK29014.1 unnamed protein product [Kuraishia capsulata CBS 1993]
MKRLHFPNHVLKLNLRPIMSISQEKKRSISISAKRTVDIADFFGKAQTKTQKREVHGESVKNGEKTERAEEKKGQPQESIGSASQISQIRFDKDAWVNGLSPEIRDLLTLEIETMDSSWLSVLYKELTKPYFLELKRFLKKEFSSSQVFPPQKDIYSWTRLTPLHEVKVLILGQDPYHNVGQAHGLAFSVKDPKLAIPPSLRNMYKCLKTDYPNFEIPKTADLTKWTKQGVLLLNTCLTVKAHQANSHANRGWELFTSAAINALIRNSDSLNRGIVVLAWGMPAQKTISKIKIDTNSHLILRTVHPSPLSASRGYFDCKHYKKCNEWLKVNRGNTIDWAIVDGNSVE